MFRAVVVNYFKVLCLKRGIVALSDCSKLILFINISQTNDNFFILKLGVLANIRR